MTMQCDDVRSHYVEQWNSSPTERRWKEGPVSELPPGFCVLEFAPTETRHMWTYATCCMSEPGDEDAVELHLFSPVQTLAHVELLTVVSHFHRNVHHLGLGHSVNFGRPWLLNSRCEYGVISLPYLDGPSLEWLRFAGSDQKVRCLWLVPITAEERDYKRLHGLEALEGKFEESQFDYLDPMRRSVV